MIEKDGQNYILKCSNTDKPILCPDKDIECTKVGDKVQVRVLKVKVTGP